MSQIGEQAPHFTLKDHFGRDYDSAARVGKSHQLLLFYPLDFTPT